MTEAASPDPDKPDEPAARKAPFEIANVRLFVLFRLLYNARFYYPVFTILFLDFGLTLEQFALLNVVWAATIVLAEVPSGALADLVGRRALIVASATLMLIELGTIALVPLGDADVVFAAFVINRICSGLAEAAASGADEALAYDSLVAEGSASEWPLVLERLGRASSLAFFVAMIVGALVYDPDVVNGVLGALGSATQVGRAELLRVPLFMTLVTGGFAWITALRMSETGPPRERFGLGALRAAWVQILEALRWTWGARFVLFVILGGLILDSVGRQFVLLASEYFRLIQIPTYLFGPLMAGMALLGVVTARLGRHMAENWSPLRNLLTLSAMQVFGLVGLSFAFPYWGVVFVPFVFSMMGLVGLLQSHYLNAHVDSAKRATVLSVKGLALNIGMGTVSALYALLIRGLESQSALQEPQALRDEAFLGALDWFAPYYLVTLVLLLIAGRLTRCQQPEPVPASALPGQAGPPR